MLYILLCIFAIISCSESKKDMIKQREKDYNASNCKTRLFEERKDEFDNRKLYSNKYDYLSNDDDILLFKIHYNEERKIFLWFKSINTKCIDVADTVEIKFKDPMLSPYTITNFEFNCNPSAINLSFFSNSVDYKIFSENLITKIRIKNQGHSTIFVIPSEQELKNTKKINKFNLSAEMIQKSLLCLGKNE